MRRLVWDGHLPAVRLTRRVHVDVRDVDALIARAKDRTGAGSPLAAGPPPSRPA